MKLLFIAPYLYAPAHKEHSKNKTGFGFMVHDIASGVGKLGNQVLLAAYAFGPQRCCDGFRIAANSLTKNILYGHYQGLVRFCLGLKKSGASVKNVLKGAYYYLHTGYIRHLVKKERPDVVHIHGCVTEIEVITRMLKFLGVPYVVTLHGLLQDDAGASRYQKDCERRLVAEGNTTITVISSKMKQRFLSDYYGASNINHVHVVTNGISLTQETTDYDVRVKYGISADKKILLSVGSVCPIKNQSQTVRAFAALPQPLREQCVLLLAGTLREDYPVSKEIKALGLDNQIQCLGFIPREALSNYYRAADLTVTASLAEGFGLSMIEGFVYGIPCVAFADLDAIGDIYDECAMYLCQERSDEALAEAIAQGLDTQWDREKIIAHSKKFSLETMAENYQRVYEKTVL